jgi:hypothetical protein
VHPCTGRTAHRGSTGITLPFLEHGTRRGWGVSVMLWPLFTPGKDPVPIVQEAVWAPGSVWTGAENLAPTRIRSLDRPTRSQSLYLLSYPAQFSNYNGNIYWHVCFPFFHFSVSRCTSTQYSTWQTQHLVILIIIQASALSAVLHVIALTWKGINCSVKNRHKHEPTVKKRSQRNPYNRKKDICLWPHIALNREINVCMHFFPLLLTAYELIHHSTHR